MYSFYGGRPGNPFVIVATFGSVHDMEEAFKQGPNYTDVHYGEHVLINTENKNDITNGQIYRRGYDFNNDAGGAEYVGTIVGPAGNAPIIRMTTKAAVDEMYNTTFDHQYPERYSMGMYMPGTSLVPGKTDSGYNDAISWSCYSVRDQNGEDTTAYIGFTIPYPVIEFNANSVSSYNAPYAIRADGKNHPFYEKWTLGIPKGIKGDSINRIWVEKDDSDNHYKFYYTTKDYSESSEGVESAAQELGEYNVIEGVSLNENGTFTVRYSNGQLEETLSWVTEIEVLPDGRLKVKYNTGAEKIVDEIPPIKYIKNIQMTENGVIQVTYNTIDSETEDYETDIITNSPIKFLQSINIDSDHPADLIITYNTVDEEGQNTTQRFENALKSISNILLNPDGTLTITYNTFTTREVDEDGDGVAEIQTIPESVTFLNALKSIDGIDLSNEGKLTIFYNTSETTEDEDGQQTIIGQQISTPIRWIESVSEGIGDAAGDLIVTYNTIDVNDEKETDIIEGALDVPTSININAETQKLQVHYRAEDHEPEQIGDAINFITEAAIDSKGRLLMKFSDPNYESGQSKIDFNGDGNNTWNYIGTVSAQDLGFKENQTTIINKYLSGIINNQSQLIFDLNTNQFLSNKITAAEISNCSIKVYNKNTTDYNTPLFSIVIDENGSSHTNAVSPDLFGVHCIFNNVGVSVQQEFIPVDILIENIEFNFTISDDSSTSESIEQRVDSLENQTDTFQNRIENIQTTLTGKQDTITGGASTITNSDLATSMALVSNGSGKVAVSTTTATQLEYVHGVTSNIQTQLNNKQGTVTGSASTIVGANLTESRALITNASKKVAVSTTTAAQLEYVHGVTSAIQTQLDNKGIKNTYSHISGTEVSIPSETWRTVAQVSLAAGAYLLIGVSRISDNSTGVRAICFSEYKNSSDQTNRYEIDYINPLSGMATRLRLVTVFNTTSTKTLYLNVYQNSGRTLNSSYSGIQIVRLS